MKNPPPTSFSSLPDDILLNCLSRISRSHYRSLSLLSKNTALSSFLHTSTRSAPKEET
ncbi:unnamed protein product [Brassica oleracea var. botrytis]